MLWYYCIILSRALCFKPAIVFLFQIGLSCIFDCLLHCLLHCAARTRASGAVSSASCVAQAQGKIFRAVRGNTEVMQRERFVASTAVILCAASWVALLAPIVGRRLALLCVQTALAQRCWKLCLENPCSRLLKRSRISNARGAPSYLPAENARGC